MPLKSKLLLFIVLLLCSKNIFAQKTNQKHNIEFGINAGLNFSRANLDSYIPYISVYSHYTQSSYHAGFSANAFVDIPLSSKFIIQPEIGYTQYNQKQVYSNYSTPDSAGGVTFHDVLKENIVELSLNLKYKIKYFSICVVPQLGYILTATNHSTENTAYPSGYPSYYETKIDFKEFKKLKNPIFKALLGVERDKIYKNIGAGIFYCLGLSDFTSDYNMRQIGKISGFVVRLNLILSK